MDQQPNALPATRVVENSIAQTAGDDEIDRFLSLSATEKFRLLMAAIELLNAARIRDVCDSESNER